ncbi:EamA family transporter [Sulfitobacter pseudonitzschiae]|uniref:EamA family transporter n=1 Tax=Pseudosulfitobacter pseudonitzschiae TaxID=1402135 RepID=A0A9Q2RZR9_9RHOB|nr:EamA family transporter [Pseudosulfitobacter pseudonitzschiae]MBM2291803.1 EamA family transporter [Pseudosulfitobacter pseudonitzschiae]MBM2296721.1 EamA family transporter [Pseudosulfitobacter pseudonitzschiae]MBM2301634.1 EamA family transporter [Pseudosulfitobacter pseudonitzschiae]MBM2311417.1 EamA family transporter [Pseudosulfitobacter pseudonitzschiae]MBM2316331.1 EamA family transporter [Pseudosulfitobacter pseudonitzschiae]
MPRHTDLALAALAPAIWGSSYIVTTQMLPDGYPLTVAMLRALPTGILLMVITRRLPPVAWLGKLAVLGALNFSIFWAALFLAAYRLPGGVAATLGAVQPLIVLLLARAVLGSALHSRGLIAAIVGVFGVALLVLDPAAHPDGIGILAALGGAVSMACGVVLTRKWQPPVPALTFTAWQLTAGGLLLLPFALAFEPALPPLTATNIAGFLWLGLIGAALTYFFWFRGIERLGPAAITRFGFLSPLTAVILGWALLGERLSPAQLSGAVIVILCVALGGTPAQRSSRSSRRPA